MMPFLVVYDRRRLLAEITEYAGANPVERASMDRNRRETANRDRNVEEVVTLLADSLDDLRTTHSRYFFTEPTLVQSVS